MEIQVEHLTRVEGHGNIIASVREGRVQKAIFEIVEANRFFEGFLRGKSYEEVCHLASRICGICSLSHSSAALSATERAFGMQVTDQVKLLRRLAMNAEVISSHALHVYFLAAPDFLGLQSVVPLVKSDPETVKRAFRIKKTGYDLAEVLVGRHTHPVGAVPGGFTMPPRIAAMQEIRDRLVALRGDLEATVSLYQKLDLPHFERPTEYVSLRQPDHYSFLGGDIVSSEGHAVEASRYREALKEYVVPHSTAKHVRWHRESYLVGALARLNNNWRQLRPEAKSAMKALGLTPPCHNPFLNNTAQVVELVHCLEDSIALLEQLLERGMREEWEPEVTPRAGRGVGVVEAPRGLLIHDYIYDDRGRCEQANCIIPTGQSLANLDADLFAYAAHIADRPQEEVQRGLEMLVRAYDPCISCSVH